MPTNKEELTNWLADIADAAEIRIEISTDGKLDLTAILGGDVQLLVIGDTPYLAEQDDLEPRKPTQIRKQIQASKRKLLKAKNESQ